VLLALDAGNSNITIGAFEGRKLVFQWRLRTVHDQTADEWGILLRNLFGPANLDIDSVDGIVISSVVPPIDSTLAFMAQRYFHTQAMFVGPRTDLGLTILYDNPNEVGADRLVNAVAGIEKFGVPLIVVDFGTATSFDVINDRKEYLGGLICPGLKISAEALFQRASRLPRVEIAEPERLVGRNTVQAMQSGIFYGYVGLVDGLLDRLLAEYPEAKVAATGGLARVIAPHTKHIKLIAPDLMLEGLRILWFRNQGVGRK
jgi:type III pantothenate kinase